MDLTLARVASLFRGRKYPSGVPKFWNLRASEGPHLTPAPLPLLPSPHRSRCSGHCRTRACAAGGGTPPTPAATASSRPCPATSSSPAPTPAAPSPYGSSPSPPATAASPRRKVSAKAVWLGGGGAESRACPGSVVLSGGAAGNGVGRGSLGCAFPGQESLAGRQAGWHTPTCQQTRGRAL